MIIVVDDYGVSINIRNRSFQICKDTAKRQISPHRVTAIHIRKGCDISSPAILLAAEHEIPVLFFDRQGKVKARLWQARFSSLAEIRRRQIYWSDRAEGFSWAVKCILHKCERQRKVLKYLQNRVPSQKDALKKAAKEMDQWEGKIKLLMRNGEGPGHVNSEENLPEKIRVMEAQVGKNYWGAYFSALKKHEPADKRTRQPAEDPLNALINYGYGMLYGEVEACVLTAGLDPHIGILHRENYNRPAFVFDAIEPYRPWVDRLVAELAIGGKMKKEWFKVDGKKVWLRKEGKHIFIPAWYQKINEPTNFRGKRIKRKDQIQHQMTSLAQSFLPGKDEMTKITNDDPKGEKEET